MKIGRFGIFLCTGILTLSVGARGQQAGQGSASQTHPSAPQTQSQPAAPQMPAATGSQPAQQPTASQGPNPKQKSRSAASTTKRTASKRRKPKPTPTTEDPSKVVVRNGGVKEDSVQLAPAMTKEQELQSRQKTARILASTDANLKGVDQRQLSPAQQNMLDEIRAYVRQSRGATNSGDLERAQTLAHKALLLSGELAKK